MTRLRTYVAAALVACTATANPTIRASATATPRQIGPTVRVLGWTLDYFDRTTVSSAYGLVAVTFDACGLKPPQPVPLRIIEYGLSAPRAAGGTIVSSHARKITLLPPYSMIDGATCIYHQAGFRVTPRVFRSGSYMIKMSVGNGPSVLHEFSGE